MESDKASLLALYRTMRLIRRFEERVVELVNRNEIRGVPVKRRTRADVPMPSNPSLESYVVPQRARLVSECRAMLARA